MEPLNSIYGDYRPPTALEKVAGTLRRLGHTLSMIPFIGVFGALPVIAATALESVNHYFTRGFGAGTKALLSGTADTIATSISGHEWWMKPVNWVSGLSTGDSLGELARKSTQGVLDSVLPDSFSGVQQSQNIARQMQYLGAAPLVRASVPAAVGYAMPSPQLGMIAPRDGQNQPMPSNFWSDREAQRRGQSPEIARANWERNNHSDAVALRNAAQQNAQAAMS